MYLFQLGLVLELEPVLGQGQNSLTDLGAVEVLSTEIKGSLVQDLKGFVAKPSSEPGFSHCSRVFCVEKDSLDTDWALAYEGVGSGSGS